MKFNLVIGGEKVVIALAEGPHGVGGVIEKGFRRVRSFRYNTILDAIEAILLSHACAGIAIADAKYIEGIEKGLESFE